MDTFFNEKGEGSSFFNKRLEVDGVIEDTLLNGPSDPFADSSFMDLDNSGKITFRALETSDGIFVTENGGIAQLRIDMNAHSIYSAGTGEMLGRVVGNDIFDAGGRYCGRIADGESPEQVALAATRIFIEGVGL
jgi:hypothetical protein